MIKDLVYLVPEIVLLLTNALMMVSKNNRFFSIFCLLSVLLLLVANFSPFDQPIMLFNNFAYTSPEVELSKILILISGTLVLSMVKAEDYKNEIPILMIFGMIGTMTIASANNFMILYLGLELQSIIAYVLTTLNSKKDPYSAEAGMKYFVLSAIASGMMLYGISLIYGSTGSTGFEMEGVVSTPWLNIGIVLVLGGLMFKISIAPFHMWVADVFQGASSIAAAFLATVPKIGLIMVLKRIVTSIQPYEEVTTALVCLGVISVFVSALGGLAQKNLKRLIAYSSIGHLGYIIAALSTGYSEIYIQYLIVYIITSLGFFAFLLSINRYEITELAGLSKNNPLLAFCVAVLSFSLAGLPPLAGFFIKLDVLKALISFSLWLPITILVFSTLSVFFYAKIVKVIYFDPGEFLTSKLQCSIASSFVIGLSVIFSLLFIFFHSAVSEMLKLILV